MTDGMLDFLGMVILLGVVLAVAFGFILPLSNEDVMQYNSQYNDKAELGILETYENPEEYERMSRHYYTYEELVLLYAVQDSRVEEPKSLSLRNLVGLENSSIKFNDYVYGNHSSDTDNNKANGLNDLYSKSNMLQTIGLYAENAGGIIAGAYSPVRKDGRKNIGFVKFTEDYGITVDNFAKSLSKVGNLTKSGGFDTDLRPEGGNNKYFIEYQFAMPYNDSKIKKDIYNKGMFVIHTDETYDKYQELVEKVRENH